MRKPPTKGHFRGLIASGVHTIAIAQRLLTQTVLNQWAVIAGLGFEVPPDP